MIIHTSLTTHLTLMNNVKLIHSTANGEDLIAYMARVSNPNNQDNPSYSKLIKYLIDHKHWSPFEMVNMCVEIETTRSVAAQILRHRSFSFQEFSQRYAVAERAQPTNIRRQDKSNRQNSIDDVDPYTVQDFQVKQSLLFDMSYKLYDEMLQAGIAKECARDVLPLATPTRMYMNGTLRSWLHYCDLRCGNGTQKEHKDIADQCKLLVQDAYPVVYDAMWP
jgi:thymidylate synthase (FAD)